METDKLKCSQFEICAHSQEGIGNYEQIFRLSMTSGMEDGRSRWRTDDRRSGGQESQVSEETRAGEWCADVLSLEGVLQQFNCI